MFRVDDCKCLFSVNIDIGGEISKTNLTRVRDERPFLHWG